MGEIEALKAQRDAIRAAREKYTPRSKKESSRSMTDTEQQEMGYAYLEKSGKYTPEQIAEFRGGKSLNDKSAASVDTAALFMKQSDQYKDLASQAEKANDSPKADELAAKAIAYANAAAKHIPKVPGDMLPGIAYKVNIRGSKRSELPQPMVVSSSGDSVDYASLKPDEAYYINGVQYIKGRKK